MPVKIRGCRSSILTDQLLLIPDHQLEDFHHAADLWFCGCHGAVVDHVSADDPPTLLIAGDRDDLVPIKHSRDIQAAFAEKGVTSQLMEIAGAGHGITGEDSRRAAAEMVAWFEKHLAK